MKRESKVEKKILHYVGKAIHDYNLIQTGDRVMVCLSGGKDSFTLLTILNQLKQRSNNKFELFSLTLDQSQPGWNDSALKEYLTEKKIPFEVITRDTYSVVKEKTPTGKTYCALCSRMRRGILYRYAEEHGFNKVALGHHRDDSIETLLMSVFYGGHIKAMPPKLLSDNKKNILIRPLAYVQEKDIIEYAKEQAYPIIPCNLCGTQDNLMRQKVKSLIHTLAKENPKVPSNMLHAISSIKPSQLMDKKLFDFINLENQQESIEPSD